MAKRKALFGGTFDPIHNGHLALVCTCMEQLKLDGVLLMPTFVPPHKLKASMASPEHRLCMCRLAAADCPGLEVSDLEIQRGGASFTADTLEALHVQEPDTEWVLLTGADMFLSLGTWWRFEDIARLAVLCAVPRDGVTGEQLAAYAAELEARGARCRIVDTPPPPVSSTEVRRRIRVGLPLTGLVPPAVEAYMEQEGLYRTMEHMETHPTDEQFTEIIRKRLKPKRFAHSLAVAEEARRLAGRYGTDPAKAYTAGLLHDIMKNTPAETQLQILKEFGILLDNVEAHTEKLLHARSGAVFVEKVLGVNDPEIVTAIRYHTTARAGMGLLEKVLYLADFTSADRDYPDVEEMRRLVDIRMEDAMEYALTYTIRELLEKQQAIHLDTVAAYNEIMLQKHVIG